MPHPPVRVQVPDDAIQALPLLLDKSCPHSPMPGSLRSLLRTIELCMRQGLPVHIEPKYAQEVKPDA